MKKTLAAILALITITSAALVACNEKEPGGDTGSSDNGGFDLEIPSGTNSDSNSDSESGTTSGTGTGSTITDDFTAVSKTVYVMSDVNLRSEPNFKQSSIVRSAVVGTQLAVTAKNSSWYKITYEGTELYVLSEYVTDNVADTQFSDVASTDTLKTLTISKQSDEVTSNTVNLRAKPVVYEDVATVTVDDTKVTADKPLKILKKNASGTWFVVEYAGQQYYVAINSTTKPCFNELKGQGGGSGAGG